MVKTKEIIVIVVSLSLLVFGIWLNTLPIMEAVTIVFWLVISSPFIALLIGNRLKHFSQAEARRNGETD